MHKLGSPEFSIFLDKVENLVSQIKVEKPYLMLFAEVFNAHFQAWWTDGELANLFSDIKLTQLSLNLRIFGNIATRRVLIYFYMTNQTL